MKHKQTTLTLLIVFERCHCCSLWHENSWIAYCIVYSLFTSKIRDDRGDIYSQLYLIFPGYSLLRGRRQSSKSCENEIQREPVWTLLLCSLLHSAINIHYIKLKKEKSCQYPVHVEVQKNQREDKHWGSLNVSGFIIKGGSNVLIFRFPPDTWTTFQIRVDDNIV